MSKFAFGESRERIVTSVNFQGGIFSTKLFNGRRNDTLGLLIKARIFPEETRSRPKKTRAGDEKSTAWIPLPSLYSSLNEWRKSNGVNLCFFRRRFEGGGEGDTRNSSNVVLGERERNRRIAKEEGLRFFASASLYRVSLAIRNYAAQGPLTAKLRSWSFHGAIFYPGFIHRGESQRGEEER